MRRGTYSIVARDQHDGAVGVAVHSHWFSVGSVVPWVRPGAGAVALQSVPDPGQGPVLLDHLAGGASAQHALDAVLAGDPSAAYRQTAAVDHHGGVAVHTGPGCIPHAGDARGDGFCCQANMMARAGVPEAMAEAYAGAQGDLADRLVAALDAAEAAGGDVRGRQSSALVVAPAGGPPFARAVDLRVEDHADPLAELRRLLVLHRAYALAGQADELMATGRHAEAGERYEQASRLAPENDELLFWAGLAAAQAGDLHAGVPRVRQAIAIHAGWRELLDRLGPEIAPAAADVRAALGA